MSQALRKLTGSVSRSNCIIYFTNQIRMKIGVMFGSPETTTGGNALKFYASVRMDVRRVGAIKEATPSVAGKDVAVVGNRTRVKVVKNKMAPPFREVEFDILYGYGVSRSGEVIDMASDEGIVQKSGAWYSLEGERIGQGRDNARNYLDEHPELLNKLEARLLEKHGIKRRAGGANGAAASSDAAKSLAREPAAKPASEAKAAPAPANKAAPPDTRNGSNNNNAAKRAGAK
jgi:recombination protein RecA